MFNNEVTYNEKWETPENKAALKKLVEKYFARSRCYPDCPVSWAPEVLELLETLDKELGISYNTDTSYGYYITFNLVSQLFIQPFKDAGSTFYDNFIKRIDGRSEYEVKKRSKPVLVRLASVFDSFMTSPKYCLKAFKIRYINQLLNLIYKPKLTLDQVKEKYGGLRIYFTTSEFYEPYVEHLIAKTEIKLALKGCYYPVESFWNAGRSRYVGNDFYPDIVKSEEKIDSDGKKVYDVFESTHRKAMKELGIDLSTMEERYENYKKSRDDLP